MNGREFEKIGRVSSESGLRKRSFALSHPAPGLVRAVDRASSRSGLGLVAIGQLTIAQNLAQPTAIKESMNSALLDIMKLISGEVSIVGMAVAQNTLGQGTVYTDAASGGAEAIAGSVEHLLSSSNFTASEQVYGELAYAAIYDPTLLHPSLLSFLQAVVDAGHQIHVAALIRGALSSCPEAEYGCGVLISKVGGIEIYNQKTNDRSSPLWKLIEWVLTECPEDTAPSRIKSGSFWGQTPMQILFPQSNWGTIPETGEGAQEELPGDIPGWYA